MLGGMGKTSVYLPGDLAERVRASGVPMAELIRRGLDAGAPPPLGEVVRAVVREELAVCCMAGGGRDDTRSRSRSAGTDGAAQDGAAGESPARDAVPRAAGAAPSRGAQPPGRRRKTDAGAGLVTAEPPGPPGPPSVAVADVRAPAGTAVFRDQGGDPVVTSPVPVIRRASDLPSPPRCPHKGVRQIGGWCPKCQAQVQPGGKLPADWVKPEGWTGSHER